MNIKELLTRISPSVYSVEECQFIVEQYILQEKKVVVEINVYKDINMSQINHPITQMLLTRQLQLLNIAFLQASEKLNY